MPVNNVSLLAPSSQPYDLAAKGLTLQQQMQLAQALIAKSMEDQSPIIHTGGGNPFARDVPNIGGPIGQVAEAYFGKKQRDEANAGMNDLALETRRRTQEDMGHVTDALMGRMEPSGMPPTEGQPDHLSKPPDYKEAIRLAQASSVPGVNAFAQKLLEGIPTPDKYLQYGQHFDKGGMGNFAQTLSPTALAERPKTSVADNIATTTQDGKVTGTQAVQHFGVKEVAPGLPGEVSVETGGTKGLSGGVVTPAAKYEEQYTQAMMSDLSKGKVDYLSNMSKMNNIATVKQQIDKLPDEKFGTAAEIRNSFNRMVEAIGGQPLPETNNMEVLGAALHKFVLDDAHKLAPVTKTDIQELLNTLGSAGYTKRGLTQMMDILGNATARNVNVYRETVKGMKPPNGISQEAHMNFWAPDVPVGAGTPASDATMNSQATTVFPGRTIKYEDWGKQQ